jgi:hypothetical protein
MFNSVQGGYIGNIAGNPFGSDFVVPQQRKPVPGGPQMAPLKQPPARVFPPDQPGREGAIDVRLAMGMPGMNNEETTRRQEPSYPMFGPGSMGMIGANIEEATRRNEPSYPMFGPGSMGMIGANIEEATRRNEPSYPMFGPGSMGMIGGNIGNVGSMTSTLRGNPYGNSTQIMSNTQQAKEAGFNRKTVS